MTAPSEVTIQLDWDRHLSAYRGRDPRTGDEIAEPMTVEDMVLVAAANVVAERVIHTASTDAYNPLVKQAREMVKDKIGDRVEAAVASALAEPRQRTDGFGQPQGDPITLAEFIRDEVAKHLTVKGPDPYGNARNTGQVTLIEAAIAKAVKDEVAIHVKAAVTEARDAIVQRVAASTTEVLTAGLSRALDAKA